MIKIEVTGNSIPEVADKLLALGASLRASTAVLPIANGGTGAETIEEVMEVAEAAPANPTPARKSAPAAKATESQPTTEEASSTPAPAASASKELSFEADVTPVVLALVQAKGKPVVEEILAQFGVERASQLDPARWSELVDVMKDRM